MGCDVESNRQKHELRLANDKVINDRIKKLRDEGLSISTIAKRLGKGEALVKYRLNIMGLSAAPKDPMEAI